MVLSRVFEDGFEFECLRGNEVTAQLHAGHQFDGSANFIDEL